MSQTLSFQDRLYNKQAEIITEQRTQIESLKKQIKEMSDCAHFYKALIAAIGDDIMLQDEWRRFIAVLRLSNPDLPGITKAFKEFS